MGNKRKNKKPQASVPAPTAKKEEIQIVEDQKVEVEAKPEIKLEPEVSSKKKFIQCAKT